MTEADAHQRVLVLMQNRLLTPMGDARALAAALVAGLTVDRTSGAA